MNPFFLELLGYTASVLVAVSLTMKGIVRLRIVNGIGAAVFSIYGLLIGSYPVAGMNAFIVGINIYYLLQMRKPEEQFTLIESTPADPYVSHLLEFYAADIQQNQPGFDGVIEPDSTVLVAVRDAVPAGIIIGKVKAPVFEIQLDYVPPQYRDFKVGRFVFETSAGVFDRMGCDLLRAKPAEGEHGQYLEKLGFKKTGTGWLERQPG
jgi:hypothetical protein